MSFRKLLRQWFSSSRRPLNNERGARSARAKGRLQLERLEERLAPATVSDIVNGLSTKTLTFALAPNEYLTVSSSGTTYTFGTNQSFTNGGVASGSDFSAFGTSSLTLQNSGILRYTTAISITDTGTGAGSAFTGSISGNTLTVSALSPGTRALAVGQTVTGPGVAPSTFITGLGTGQGGPGTYTVFVGQSISSESMTSGSPTVSFVGAPESDYANNFNIDLSNPNAGPITFNGTSKFGANTLTASTTSAIDFQGGASVPYQGMVTVADSSNPFPGDQTISMPDGANWAALGFAVGDTISATNPNNGKSGTYSINQVSGNTLYVLPLSGTKLPSGPNAIPNVTVAESTAQVSAASMSLTAANSLTVQSTGVPYLGPVTINTAPLAGQPYSSDEFITGPDWGSYGYKAGDTITVANNGTTIGTATIAGIAGDNLYLVSSPIATGNYSAITVTDNVTPEITTGSRGLTLNVTGSGSTISGAVSTPSLGGGTNNGNITLQDDVGLDLNALDAGTARIQLDVKGSIWGSQYLAGNQPRSGVNLTAGALDLTTTGLSTEAAGSAAIVVATQTEKLTATTNDGPIYIFNTGSAPLAVDSVVADQGGQAPVVNDGRIEYNSAPSGSPTYVSGSNDVNISSTGPIVLNSVSATRSVYVAGASILEGNDQKQNIVAQNVNLVATGPTTETYLGPALITSNTLLMGYGAVPSSFTAGDTIFVSGAGADDGTFTVQNVAVDGTLTLAGSALQPEVFPNPIVVAFGTAGGMAAADYQGQVTFANPTTPTGNDTLALPAGQYWKSWPGFGNLTAGDAITVSGASDTVNDATFTVASVSGNILTLQQQYVLDPETEPLVTVSDCTIGLQNPTSSSSTNSGALALSEVPNFTAATANGNIDLALGASVASTAASVTAGGFGNVALSSQANFLTVENITANGNNNPTNTALAPGQVLNPGNSLFSSNNAFRLTLQPDGNLVWYDQATGNALWASQTNGQNVTQAVMQTDGNLVLFNGNTPVWASNTSGNPGAYLWLQNDGNLVLYSASGAVLSGNKLPSGSYGAVGASLGPVLGGNVAVATNNGFFLEFQDSNGHTGSINAQTVSLASTFNIGSPSSPIHTNAASALRVAAMGTSPSSAAVYVDNTSNLASVGVSTYGGSVLVNYNYNPGNLTYADNLKFSNTVLSATGSAVVAFANTDDTDGSGDNVQVSGVMEVSAISAGGQILDYNINTMITGGSVMLSAGSGIGIPGAYLRTAIVGSLDATTNTGSIYVNNQPGIYQGLVSYIPNPAGDQIKLINSGLTWAGVGFVPGDTIYVTGGNATEGGPFTIASINGGTAVLTVADVIGSDQFIATVYPSLILSATTSNGNINVGSTGSIAVGSQPTSDVSSQGSATANATLPGVSTGTSGTVSLIAGYSILNANSGSASGVDVSAGTLVLSSGNVDGTASNPLETAVRNLTATGGSLYAVNNTALTVTSTTITGNVSISTIGDLTLSGNASSPMALGNTNSSVTLTATAGQITAIYDTNSNGVNISAALLTITAEQIGSPTDFIQATATTLNATANYGGIYLYDGVASMTLSAVAVGPTPNGVPTNNIDIYSQGSIVLQSQTNTLTGTTPAAVSNPGGNLILAAGEPLSAVGSTPQGGASGSTITSPGGLIMTGLGSNTVFLTAGMSVSGPGIPAGDTIAMVNPTGSSSDGEIQLTEPVTAVENGVTFTFVSASRTINFTGNTTYYDIITGTIKDIAAAGTPLLQTKTDTMEVAVGEPGSGNAGPEIVTAAALAAAAAQGTPIKASSITIADLEFNGQPGTLTIPNSLTLIATGGPIVFLNPLDTISVTGGGSITIQANSLAALGTLTTQGGTISITASSNISIGTINAGTGSVLVNSISGSIFSNNGGSLQITAGSTTLQQMSAGQAGTGQNAAAPLNNSLAQLQLNAAQAIATAAAASAQAAADQTTANAFKSELTSIGAAVTNDEQTYQADVLATQNDASAVQQAQAQVTSDNSTVNGLVVTYANLEYTVASVGIAGSIAATIAAFNAEVPVVATTTAVVSAAIQLGAAVLNLGAAIVNAQIVTAENQLSVDSTTLSTAEATAGTDQSHEDQAIGQLQADLDTQTALTAAYNFAEQAATSAAISAAEDQAAAEAASSQVSAASAQANAQANAQAVAAGLDIASGSSPTLVVRGGPLTISGQAGGAVSAPISAPDAGVTIQSSPITVSANITASGAITLLAQSLSVPPATSGADLSVASGVTIYSIGSSAVPTSVTLVAGDNVLIPSGATIQAGPRPGPGVTQPDSTISIICDLNDTPNGANVTVAGTLIAKSALIGVANYQGQATFASASSGDTFTLPNTGPSWTSLGFAPGESISLSGQGSLDGNYPIAGISPDGYTLVMPFAHPPGPVFNVDVGVTQYSTGPETFNITPSATTPITVTGDFGTTTLNFNAAGLAVSISGNTIQAAGMQPVTFTNILTVNIIDAANGGASLTLTGTSGANTLILVGTGQEAGGYILNGQGFAFSGVASFTYQGGGGGDSVSVTPFAASGLPWNLAVTVNGSSAATASLTYNSVNSLADTVTPTRAGEGSVGSPGLAMVNFSNVGTVTTNASQIPGDELTVNLHGTSAPVTATLQFPGQNAGAIAFNGLFDLDIMTGYAGLTINGGRGTYDLGNSSAALPMPLTLNTPDVQCVVNTGTTSTLNATASGDTIGVTAGGQVTVTGLSGNVSFDVSDPQLVINVPGISDTINVAGNHPFTNGLYLYGTASFSDTLNDKASSGDGVTVTPISATITETGAGRAYGPVVYAGINNVNLIASGATSTLTVAGSAQPENFAFTPTAAGAGSFTTGLGAASGSTPQFTYTGIGKGITVNGGTSGTDQLSLTCTPSNGGITTLAAEQTAAGTLAFTLNAFSVPFTLSKIGSVNISEAAGNALFEIGVAAALEKTPTASLNFHVVGSSIYNDHLLVKDEGGEPAGSHDVITLGAVAGSGLVEVGALHPVTFQDIGSATFPPTVTVSDAGGTSNGKPFAATAHVNGGASLDGIKPTLTYYSYSGSVMPTINYYNGTFTPPAGAVRLPGAPSKAGSYAVVASFAGDGTYAPNWAWTRFTISPAKGHPVGLTVHSAPTITASPVNLTIHAGRTATFTAAANSTPAASVQWQVSSDGGSTFSNIKGATSGTYSFAPTRSDSGKRFRAVFLNANGTTATRSALLMVVV